MLVGRWCSQSGPLKVIGQFSQNGFGWNTCLSSVGFDPSIVSQVSLIESLRLLVSFSAWLSCKAPVAVDIC